MFLQKHIRTLVVGAFFGSLALFSCAQKNPTETASDTSGTGKAVVHLPDLSSGRLEKLPVGVDTNALTLMITAPGMDTIKYSWKVTSLKGQTVVINGIPAGSNRLFEGFLTNKSGVLTHTGKVSVNIIAGQEVPVNLRLSGTGSADVCIEIEGFPSACGQNDSLTIFNCLNVSAISGRTNGTLKLYVWGSVAAGTLTFTKANGDSAQFYEISSKSSIKIADSASYKYCTTVAFERNTGVRHALYLVINKNSEIVYGLLSRDTTLMNNTIAKFYSVKCNTSPVDTLTVSTCIGSRISSETITGQINMSVFGKSTVSGTLQIIKNGSQSTYYFSKLIRMVDSSNITCIKTTLVSDSSKSTVYLDMYLTRDSSWYAILSRDGSLKSVIAEMQMVNCTTPYTDTTKIFTCIEGRTPSSDLLKGRIKMVLYGYNAFGYINMYNTKDNIYVGTYSIEKVIKITDDSKYTYLQAIVLNDLAQTRHYLDMVINKVSGVADGYISENATSPGNAIVKFSTVDCSTPAVDTTYIKVPLIGKGYAETDSVSFTATMSIKVANEKVSGTIYFNNCPLVKASDIAVTGIYKIISASSSDSSEYLELNSTNTTGCYYQVVFKIRNGVYNGYLYQKGTCGDKTIASLNEKPVY